MSMAQRVRSPAVAGRFYPDDPVELRRSIDRCFRDARRPAGEMALTGLISPHAGYVYSGPVAASAFGALSVEAGYELVILLGPSHFVPFRGLALSGARAFDTPLGSVPVDRAATERAIGLPHVHLRPEAHEPEHSLEVQLPFLQTRLEDFRILPILVGDAAPAQVAVVLEALWGTEATLLVVSSDLSHYLPYDAARRTDADTCRAIEALDAGSLDERRACGWKAVAGLLLLARERGLRPVRLDCRNSGDTGGSRHSVVGYAAFAFSEATAGRQTVT
ncbi:MAG: AmmeMemoRadiSam system protein B [Gemmatimonadota bacterium]|nr:MAG: AmmeMemoRadiSam system protein B [Gemmatimonadota bacterium]